MKKFFVIVAVLSLTACTNPKLVVPKKNTANLSDNIQTKTMDSQKTKEKEPNQKVEKRTSQKDISKNDNLKTSKKNENMNKAIIKTNKGDITIELNTEKAPISVENFKKYASEGYYNGTIFHRVIPGFMIQGGGFDESGKQKTTKAPIKNEAKNGLKNDRGTLAMARTQVVDSATSQFFINLVDNDFLNYKDEINYGYAVFGRVIDGMGVVDDIAKVKTGSNGPHENWPKENIVIENIEFIK